MFKYLRRKMPDAQIPSEARMLGLAMLIVNLPALVYGLFFWWFVIPIPGLILYGNIIVLTLGKKSPTGSELTTIFTMVYHLALLIMVICFFPGWKGDDFMIWSYIAAMPIATICFGALLLRTLKEAKTSVYESH